MASFPPLFVSTPTGFPVAANYPANLTGYKKYLKDAYDIDYKVGDYYPMTITLKDFKRIDRRTPEQIKEDLIFDLNTRICNLYKLYNSTKCDVTKEHHGKRLKVLNDDLWRILTTPLNLEAK